MSEFLSRDQILGAVDLETEEVEVPEWDGKVLVSELTGTARDFYQASLIEFSEDGQASKVKLEEASVRLVALSIVDPETRAPYFGNGDVRALGALSGRALNRVYQVAQRLSRLSDEDVKELVGNFGGTPSEDSSSE